MAIERWNHPELEHRGPFEHKAFVSIDPGADGWALAWDGREGTGPVGFCHALDPMALIELFALVDARVGVVESQFITQLKNARHILELSFRNGMSLGWLAAELHRGNVDLNLFEVAPATWQAHQRKLAGIERRLERGEGIELALASAKAMIGHEPEWRKALKKQKEGLASALGIGVWWRALWEPEPIKVRR